MVEIRNNMIIMTRGDTLRTKVTIKTPDGEEYTPVEEDKIRFALKSNYNDAEPLLIKEIPYDTMVLQLDPADTKSLTQPADYVYDIQITLSDGTVDTFLAKQRLRLTEEVD